MRGGKELQKQNIPNKFIGQGEGFLVSLFPLDFYLFSLFIPLYFILYN